MSRWLYPFERRILWEKRRRLAIGLLIGFVVLSLLDRTLYYGLFPGAELLGPEVIKTVQKQADPAAAQRQLEAMDVVRHQIERKDGIAALRTAGYLPAWIAAGTALLIAFAPWGGGGSQRRGWGGLSLIAAAALAGGAAEVIKPLVGRLRPMFTDGEHHFRHAPRFFEDSQISYGMASSHAAVAFGAAFAILFVYGGAGWVALAVAAACGVTRMMTGAHFATDVYVAAVLGYACARLLCPREREGLLLP